MNLPIWLKPALFGAVGGAVVVSIVGFSWGGWVTGSSADEMASVEAHDAVIAALVPVCVDLARNDVDREAKLATIREAASYKRRDAVMDAGWATVPGADAPSRDLAQACIPELEAGSS